MNKFLIILFSFFGMQSQNNPDDDFKLAIELFKKKDYINSLASLDRALIKDSLNQNYLMLKTSILYSTSKCEDALNTTNKMYLANGNRYNDGIITFYCDVYECLGQEKLATEILKKYVEKKEFNDTRMLTKLGQRLLNLGDSNAAALYYNQYIEKNPNDIDAIVDLARILFTFKNKEKARDLLIKSLVDNPDNLVLLAYLTNYFLKNNDYDNALKYQDKLVSLKPLNIYLEDRAMIYENKGMLKEAYSDYLKMIETDLCNSTYYFKILKFEFDNRMYKENIEHSLKLIACNSVYKNDVLDGLYTSFFFCNDFKKGNEYLNQKLAYFPDNFNPYYIKALTLFKDKQYREILEYLDLAIKTKDITPNDIANIAILKMAYFLITEDFEGFKDYWKYNDGEKMMDKSVSFSIIEEPMGEKAELLTIFDKETGVIKSSLIVPTKVFRLLRDRYGLTFDIKSN